MDEHIDVVIIGAGPGGCAAAIISALKGLQVCLVEQSVFPRDRPGETLHPGIQPLMAQLGVEDQLLSAGFTRHKGHWIHWDGERRFENFGSDENGPWLGFQAWRADFDAILLERACALGVDVRQPCRVQEPIGQGGRVVGVETSDGPILARTVIDAGGDRHWLARRLSLPIERHSPHLMARYGYASSSVFPDEQLPAIIADPCGWTWYAKIHEHHYHWTRLMLHEESNGHDLPESNSHAENPKSARGADVTWRAVSRPAGPGYFIIGDAAAVLDPASSHGVLKSLMSGIMAARVIHHIHDRPGEENYLLDSYVDWGNEWFQRDLKRLKELYRTLPHPPSWLSDTTRMAGSFS